MSAMSLRAEMPQTAAFIDDLREAFGAEAINPQIKKGMAGLPGFFHAQENGREVGTPAPPARYEFTVDQLVIQSKGTDMETKCSHCGQLSRNQPSGNGCHTCQRGVMVPTGK